MNENGKNWFSSIDSIVIEVREDFKLKLISYLGEGTYSVVYKCYEMKNKSKFYAIKFLRPIINNNEIQNANTIKKFIREKDILREIKGEYVPKIYGSGIFPYTTDLNKEIIEINYYIMESLGTSVSDLRKTLFGFKQLPFKLSISISKICLNALRTFHKMNIIHLDQKPSNFVFPQDLPPFEKLAKLSTAELNECLLKYSLRIKVIDFGNSRKIKDTLYLSTDYLGSSRWSSYFIDSCPNKSYTYGYIDDLISSYFILLDGFTSMHGSFPWSFIADNKTLDSTCRHTLVGLIKEEVCYQLIHADLSNPNCIFPCESPSIFPVELQKYLSICLSTRNNITNHEDIYSQLSLLLDSLGSKDNYLPITWKTHNNKRPWFEWAIILYNKMFQTNHPIDLIQLPKPKTPMTYKSTSMLLPKIPLEIELPVPILSKPIISTNQLYQKEISVAAPNTNKNYSILITNLTSELEFGEIPKEASVLENGEITIHEQDKIVESLKVNHCLATSIIPSENITPPLTSKVFTPIYERKFNSEVELPASPLISDAKLSDTTNYDTKCDNLNLDTKANLPLNVIESSHCVSPTNLMALNNNESTNPQLSVKRVSIRPSLKKLASLTNDVNNADNIIVANEKSKKVHNVNLNFIIESPKNNVNLSFELPKSKVVMEASFSAIENTTDSSKQSRKGSNSKSIQFVDVSSETLIDSSIAKSNVLAKRTRAGSKSKVTIEADSMKFPSSAENSNTNNESESVETFKLSLKKSKVEDRTSIVESNTSSNITPLRLTRSRSSVKLEISTHDSSNDLKLSDSSSNYKKK